MKLLSVVFYLLLIGDIRPCERGIHTHQYRITIEGSDPLDDTYKIEGSDLV